MDQLGGGKLGMQKWMMDNVKFSVKEPVGILLSIFLSKPVGNTLLLDTSSTYIHLNMQIEAAA